MGHDGSGITALLGLDGFVALAHLEEEGEMWVKVETTASVVGCEECGSRAVGHGRRLVQVRDLPVAGRPVRLVWAKRLWRCPDPGCPAGTWSEDSDEIAPRAVLTERARAEICRQVGPGEVSVAAVARGFGVSWHTAMAAVIDHGRPRVDHLARLGAPVAIGLDETSYLSATAARPTQLVTGIVDLDSGRLIDVVGARSASAVRTWLSSKPLRWRAGIDHVVIDPYQPYATAVRHELPDARVVVDHFHVIRLANSALDEVRRRVQQSVMGHHGRNGDPLYRVRRRLLARHEDLTPTAVERMLAWLNTGDPTDEVASAWMAKELLREVFATDDPIEARRRPVVFYEHCTETGIAELDRLAGTSLPGGAVAQKDDGGLPSADASRTSREPATASGTSTIAGCVS